MKVILYPEWGLRFFCQHKNASTSLEALLLKQYGATPLVYWDHTCLRPSNDYRWHEVFDVEASLQFTVVRNTFDRVESLFRMFVDDLALDRYPETGIHPWFRHHQQPIVSALSSGEPLLRFVEYLCSTAADGDVDSHWQSQMEHLPVSSETFEIVNFSTLQSDLARLDPGAGYSFSELPHLNESSRSTRSARDGRISDMIAEAFSAEIEAFGFTPHGS